MRIFFVNSALAVLFILSSLGIGRFSHSPILPVIPADVDIFEESASKAGKTSPYKFLEQIEETIQSTVVVADTFILPFGNPAGCAFSVPNLSSAEMLAAVQHQLGDDLNLSVQRRIYIWNGPFNTMLNVSKDPFVYEFSVNEFQRPFTYRVDEIATTFLTNGFVIWFRFYGDDLRLLAIPMVEGVLESPWGDYVRAYWQKDGIPQDEYIFPVIKKLPCRWIVDEGYVTNETLTEMFNLDWHMPDYLTAGRKYLASNCREANRISREEIGFWDASSMCGPLAWKIIKDANAYPYRIGNWYADATIFIAANPKWNGRPWLGFDPETYDVFHADTPMPGYDFEDSGNLYPGDIIYSYSTMYQSRDERFDHIFLIAGIDESNARISITNMVQNNPVRECFIREVSLYTPCDRVNGVINNEWNSFEYGRTGVMGFDVFRWKWETYHLEGKTREYTVRVGDTLETIAFDWKIPPQDIAEENHLDAGSQLAVGQKIILPAPELQWR